MELKSFYHPMNELIGYSNGLHRELHSSSKNSDIHGNRIHAAMIDLIDSMCGTILEEARKWNFYDHFSNAYIVKVEFSAEEITNEDWVYQHEGIDSWYSKKLDTYSDNDSNTSPT